MDTREGVGLKGGLPDIAWVRICGGEFLFGESKRRRSVETFWIARYPVTNAQYRAFLDAEDGYRRAEWWANLEVDDLERTPEAPWWTESNCPRESVNWFEAMAFCAWLASRLKIEVRLPDEWEWERAARGTTGRVFPWGNGFVEGRANVSDDAHPLRRTSAVGIYPDGAAREAVDRGESIHDLGGNVWEWCRNRYEPPFSSESGGQDSRVVRGGSWSDSRFSARSGCRDGVAPSYRDVVIGFRVVCSSPPSSLNPWCSRW
jgi:formylglycine-generating enzyme required for sulfatase activity